MERIEVIDFFLSHFHFPSTRECEAKPTDADATRLHLATYEPIRNPPVLDGLDREELLDCETGYHVV